MTHTFKSTRRRKRHIMPPMWRPAFDTWRRQDEARRLALPERQAEPQPGKVLQRWTFSGDGWAHDVQLLQPADRGTRRPRSDQFVLVVDDAVVLPLAGLVQIMEYLRTKVLPAQMTRLQRHQADQISEGMLSERAA